MRKQQIRTSALAALVLTVIAAVILVNRSKPETTEQIATAPTVAKPVVPQVILKPVAVDTKKVVKTASTEIALTAPEKKQLAEQLDLFHELDVKVLMNPNERERYVAILNNTNTQKLIRKAILHASKDNHQMQDRSVEFLVSAIESDINVSAIVKDIIMDAAIESSSTPQDVRQVQAELKAEILYSWTSRNPNEAAGVSGLLPGPVSQRLWNNIVQNQANNAEESLTVQ